MKHISNKGKTSEKGGALLMAACTFMFIGLAGLVVDYGLVAKAKADLTASLDAAVLAGAPELPSTAQAETICRQYFDMNFSGGGLLTEPDVVVSFPDSSNIRARGTVGVHPVLMRAFGIDNVPIVGIAQAQVMDPDIALILDRSGSMCEDSHGIMLNCPPETLGNPWEPMNQIKDAATFFTNVVMSGDANVRMSLITYSTEAGLEVPITNNHGAILGAISSIEPSGYTDIGGAVFDGVDALLNSGVAGRPGIVVLLTDGRPNMKNGTQYSYASDVPDDHVRDAAEQAKDDGMRIESIAFGAGADQALMQEVADITEGTFYFAPDQATLTAIFQAIADAKYIRLVPAI